MCTQKLTISTTKKIVDTEKKPCDTWRVEKRHITNKQKSEEKMKTKAMNGMKLSIIQDVISLGKKEIFLGMEVENTIETTQLYKSLDLLQRVINMSDDDYTQLCHESDQEQATADSK